MAADENHPQQADTLYVSLYAPEGVAFDVAEVTAAVGNVATRYGLEATSATEISGLARPMPPELSLAGRTAEEIRELHNEVQTGRYKRTAATTYAINGFYMGLKALPQEDPELALAAFEALANDADNQARSTAALFMPFLAQSAPESALPIWERLLGDNVYVAGYARRAIDEAVENGQVDAEQSVRLLRAHRRAQSERAAARRAKRER